MTQDMFDGLSQSPAIELFKQLGTYEGADWEGEILLPWSASHRAFVDDLHRIGHADALSIRLTPNEDFEPLWACYALGRILDVLIAPHEPPPADGQEEPRWPSRLPSTTAYQAFCLALGCSRIEEEAFHPFLHEIVSVLPADDPQEPPSVVAEHWPGYFVGSMLLTRAGVTVRAGSDHLVPVVAQRSCLYWTWWRRNRQTSDLSHGWGAGSQWGTDFRRDYWVAGRLHYNVDARSAKVVVQSDLDDAQARDLVRYRCSTTVDLGEDQWIWDTGHSEVAPG
jgi:hypothetical protein